MARLCPKPLHEKAVWCCQVTKFMSALSDGGVLPEKVHFDDDLIGAVMWINHVVQHNAHLLMGLN